MFRKFFGTFFLSDICGRENKQCFYIIQSCLKDQRLFSTDEVHLKLHGCFYLCIMLFDSTKHY